MAAKKNGMEHIALGASNEELQAKQRAFEEKVARGEACRVSVTSDAEDKRIDADEYGIDPLGEALSAARELEDPAGGKFAYKLLSERCVSQLGRRGYQIVKDANGDPIQVGNMTLGKIPQSVADKRKKIAQDASVERIRDMQEQHSARIAALRREAKDLGLKVLESGDSVENVGDGETYAMGITVERGDAPLV